MIEWLYEELGYASSFQEHVENPEDYGEIIEFDQIAIAD